MKVLVYVTVDVIGFIVFLFLYPHVGTDDIVLEVIYYLLILSSGMEYRTFNPNLWQVLFANSFYFW